MDLGFVGAVTLDSVETVDNQGTINGEVLLGAGDDVFMQSVATAIVNGSI